MIETIYSDPDYLQHHGVKGMKWGVRKQAVRSGNRRLKSKSSIVKRKGLSDKQKLALGVAAGAAVLGVATAVGIKHLNAANIAIGVKQVNEAFDRYDSFGRMGSQDLRVKNIKTISSIGNIDLSKNLSDLKFDYTTGAVSMASNDKLSTKIKNVYGDKTGKGTATNYVYRMDRLNETLGHETISSLEKKAMDAISNNPNKKKR